MVALYVRRPFFIRPYFLGAIIRINNRRGMILIFRGEGRILVRQLKHILVAISMGVTTPMDPILFQQEV